MRELQVVAVSDDGTRVLLAAGDEAAKATHSIRIDGRLQAAVRGQLAEDPTERRESALTPKEIQARLRAGESAEEVARAAGVPVARVLRYAGPVQSERERIVDQARAAVMRRPRGPEGTAPLGEVAQKGLAATTGLREDTVAWTARRRADGAWIVDLSYSARGGRRTASWLWLSAEHELTSLNALATRLGTAAPTKRRVSAKPARRSATPLKRTTAPATKKATTAATKATKKATRAAPAAKQAAPAAKKVAKATKSAPATTTTRATKATKATRATKAAPTAEPAAVSSIGPAAPTAGSAAPAGSAPARAAARVRTTPPDVPDDPGAPVVETPDPVEAPTRRGNARVAVPSWSDVLLGVQAPAGARGRRRS